MCIGSIDTIVDMLGRFKLDNPRKWCRPPKSGDGSPGADTAAPAPQNAFTPVFCPPEVGRKLCKLGYQGNIEQRCREFKSYFAGLCLDCLDRVDPIPPDWYYHEDAKFDEDCELVGVRWDVGCRFRHGKDIWFHSSLQRHEFDQDHWIG